MTLSSIACAGEYRPVCPRAKRGTSSAQRRIRVYHAASSVRPCISAALWPGPMTKSPKLQRLLLMFAARHDVLLVNVCAPAFVTL